MFSAEVTRIDGAGGTPTATGFQSAAPPPSTARIVFIALYLALNLLSA